MKRIYAVVALILVSAFVTDVWVARDLANDPITKLWAKCSDVGSSIIESYDGPYYGKSGTIHTMTTEELDAYCHKNLRGWKRGRHIQCFLSPICYINEKTGTAIEFEMSIPTFDPNAKGPPWPSSVDVHEVRYLNVKEKLAYAIAHRIKKHKQPEGSFIPPPLVPGGVAVNAFEPVAYGKAW